MVHSLEDVVTNSNRWTEAELERAKTATDRRALH